MEYYQTLIILKLPFLFFHFISFFFKVCNLHDVSWGTKGDNSGLSDLGAVTAKKMDNGKEIVQMEVRFVPIPE